MNHRFLLPFSFALFAAAALVPAVAAAQTDAATTSCPLITDYMKLGWKNDPAQVSALQTFLKSSEALDVDQTGIFDQKTEQAVEVFQKKYADVVLAPWDATKASGVVFITTVKKVNELACGEPLTLSALEISTIEAYKQKLAAAPAAPVVTLSASTDTASTMSSEEATGTPEASQMNGDADVTANAYNASVFSRFWSFFAGLFR